MAQFKFEGDLDNISERQLEFINKVIQEQDIKVIKVVFSPVGKAGDNFMANVKRIDIQGENGNMKMIVKIATALEMMRKMFNTAVMFENEQIMYTEVLPKLVQLQKEAGVPEEEHLKFAKCYGILNEPPYELVFLEDLVESDFVMLNKFESLSDECVKSILKNFAILHSLSYALKKKEPETYDLFKNKLTDTWILTAEDKEMEASLQNFEDEILSVFDEEHKKILRNKLKNMLQMAAKFSKTGDNRFSVIQQGDAWTNNVMFKFVGDELKESIMIDYQLSKNNNPVVDLLYMIFNCTDHETRSKNYYNWLDYYHTELDNSLSNFGLKANFVYPRDQLDADLKRYGKLLFGHSLMLANVLSRDSEQAANFKEAWKSEDVNEVLETMKMEAVPADTMVILKKRIIGLIDSFTEFGLL